MNQFHDIIDRIWTYNLVKFEHWSNHYTTGFPMTYAPKFTTPAMC